MAESHRYCAKPSARVYPLADGSAAVVDEATGRLHALNEQAAEILQQHRCWTEPELQTWLVEQGHDPHTAAGGAHVFLMSLVTAGLVTAEDSDA